MTSENPTVRQQWNTIVRAYTSREAARRIAGWDEDRQSLVEQAQAGYDAALSDAKHLARTDWLAYLDRLHSERKEGDASIATLTIPPAPHVTVQPRPPVVTTDDPDPHRTLILDTRTGALTYHVTGWDDRLQTKVWGRVGYVPSASWVTVPEQLGWIVTDRGETDPDKLMEDAVPLAQLFLDLLLSVPGTDMRDLTPQAAHTGDSLATLTEGRDHGTYGHDEIPIAYADIRDHITPAHLPGWIVKHPVADPNHTARNLSMHILGGFDRDGQGEANTGLAGRGRDGSLEVVGIVAWLYAYREHLAGGLTPVDADEWFPSHPPRTLTADTPDDQLDQMAQESEADAARSGVALFGARVWLDNERFRLRKQLRAALEEDGAQVKALEEQLKAARARRTSKLMSIMSWNKGDTDADLGRAAGMSRQAIQQLRERTEAEGDDQ